MIQHRNPTIGIDRILDSEFDSWQGPATATIGTNRSGELGIPVDDEGPLNISPQQRMWLAVIQLAVRDATLPDQAAGLDPETIDWHRRQARAVIFSRSSVTAGYFNEICDLAGVTPDIVRTNVARLIREGSTIDDCED